MNASRWRLDGQVALVTGASRGIGLATAREMAGLGADIVLVARDDVYLEKVRDELAEEFPRNTLRAFAADVGEHEQRLEVFDFIADLGLDLSLLINNVAAKSLGRAGDIIAIAASSTRTYFRRLKCAGSHTRNSFNMRMPASSMSARYPD